MNFFSNRIVNPVGGGPTFQEWIAKQDWAKKADVDPQLEKQAREAKPECDDDPRGQCRGQEINNDNEDGNGYQKGESVSGKKDQAEGKSKEKDASSQTVAKKANCGKEMGKCDDAGKVTEKHTPASSTESGSEKEKGSTTEQFINNDPNYQKGESVDGKKSDGKGGDKNTKKDDSKKASGNAFKKVASMDRKEKLKLFAVLAANNSNPRPYVEAMVGIKFANLSAEEKAFLKDFWGILEPSEYAEEMVKDR